MSREPGKWRTVPDLWRAQREGSAGLAHRQATRLAALVAHARERSRFYRQLYRHLPAQGIVPSDLPPVTKRELMASFDDWVTDPRVTLAGVEAFVADPNLIGRRIAASSSFAPAPGPRAIRACSYTTVAPSMCSGPSRSLGSCPSG